MKLKNKKKKKRRRRRRKRRRRIHPGPRLCVTFHKMLVSKGERLLGDHPTPRLEDHLMSAVPDFLFSTFPTTLHIWRPLSSSIDQGRAMPW
jgi:hypothetical protein